VAHTLSICGYLLPLHLHEDQISKHIFPSLAVTVHSEPVLRSGRSEKPDLGKPVEPQAQYERL